MVTIIIYITIIGWTIVLLKLKQRDTNKKHDQIISTIENSV